ncbi:hypothetical protein Agub_g4060 [Astrephomene gubernaculifera]|uniref:Enhancer of polycomb-like protein n=1 Tax=Astrephomene gubernaculifera TaxID=47775 RepID=A0AAD3HIY2_9CHLO|nr:hypothetical protein Agub_g4060 [Astrephomene gubernaculifera]
MSGRTIRPRPISFTERIPVIFLNRANDAEDDGADTPALDPALVQFLRTCEEERDDQGRHTLLSGLETSRRRKRRTQGPEQQLAKAAPAQGAAAARTSGGQSAGGADGDHAAAAIEVPSCRDVADYGENEQAMARADARKAAEAGHGAPLLGILPGASPGLSALGNLGLDADAYIIYHDVVRDRRAEPALSQYDMDEEDEKALEGVNAQQRAAASAAARANGATAATRSTAAAAAAAAAAILDEDGFEALMGALEQAHFEALQQQKELWQAEVKAGKVPKLPSADKILPWEAAVAALKEHQPPLPSLPRALYNHWLKRRKQAGGPLLGYLWYEQPWKAICFRDRTPGNEGEQGDMPFMATETKNSSRGGWNRSRLSKREAYDRILKARNELEVGRRV